MEEGATRGNILHVAAGTPKDWNQQMASESFTAGKGRIRRHSPQKSGRRLVFICFSFKSNVLLNRQQRDRNAVVTAGLGGRGRGRRLAARMPLATNAVLLYKRRDEYWAVQSSALCRAAWRRQASNTGQDKGQRKLLQPLNWMLLLKIFQTIQQSLLLPPLTQLQTRL